MPWALLPLVCKIYSSAISRKISFHKVHRRDFNFPIVMAVSCALPKSYCWGFGTFHNNMQDGTWNCRGGIPSPHTCTSIWYVHGLCSILAKLWGVISGNSPPPCCRSLRCHYLLLGVGHGAANKMEKAAKILHTYSLYSCKVWIQTSLYNYYRLAEKMVLKWVRIS